MTGIVQAVRFSLLVAPTRGKSGQLIGRRGKHRRGQRQATRILIRAPGWPHRRRRMGRGGRSVRGRNLGRTDTGCHRWQSSRHFGLSDLPGDVDWPAISGSPCGASCSRRHRGPSPLRPEWQEVRSPDRPRHARSNARACERATPGASAAAPSRPLRLRSEAIVRRVLSIEMITFMRGGSWTSKFSSVFSARCKNTTASSKRSCSRATHPSSIRVSAYASSTSWSAGPESSPFQQVQAVHEQRA